MQYAYPSSDIENPGGWTTEPLWALIDEEPFDDGDYLISPKSATGASFTIGLSALIDPEVHTGHVVRIRAKTAVSGTFKFELMQGAVVIKDSGDVVLTTAFAEYNMTLSEGEAANIIDYAALRVRVTAVVTQKNQRQNVSWIRVDVPDAPANEFVYGGDIPMTLIPDYSSVLNRVYAGAVTMSVLPGYSSILDRVYAGDVNLIALPNAPIAPLSKSYGGDIGFVLVSNSIYELIIGALPVGGEDEFVYAGDIPLPILPSYASILDRVYEGEVNIVVIPTSLYSGIRAALDSYPPGMPPKKVSELALIGDERELIRIGKKKIIRVGEEKPVFISEEIE